MQERTFVMSGRVSDFGLDGILQMVSLSRQFTSIELTDESKRNCGVIFLKSGQVVAARSKSQSEGKHAFFDLYARPSAFFDVFRLRSLPRYPDTLGPIPTLLVEAKQSSASAEGAFAGGNGYASREAGDRGGRRRYSPGAETNPGMASLHASWGMHSPRANGSDASAPNGHSVPYHYEQESLSSEALRDELTAHIESALGEWSARHEERESAYRDELKERLRELIGQQKDAVDALRDNVDLRFRAIEDRWDAQYVQQPSVPNPQEPVLELLKMMSSKPSPTIPPWLWVVIGIQFALLVALLAFVLRS